MLNSAPEERLRTASPLAGSAGTTQRSPPDIPGSLQAQETNATQRPSGDGAGRATSRPAGGWWSVLSAPLARSSRASRQLYQAAAVGSSATTTASPPPSASQASSQMWALASVLLHTLPVASSTVQTRS